MSNFSIPARDVIIGRYKLQSEIFKKHGTKAAITDSGILLGGYVSDEHYINDNYSLDNRTGWYWTKTDNGYNEICCINEIGEDEYYQQTIHFGGVRITLPYTELFDIATSKISDDIFEYGEYPQQAAPRKIQHELENLYKVNALTKTNKTYPRLIREYEKEKIQFSTTHQEEYLYNGKKYIRVIADTFYDNEYITLSNRQKCRSKDAIWVEIQPISWIIDEKKNIAITEKILFSGIQFNNKTNYKGDFSSSLLKSYIDREFAHNIIPSKIMTPYRRPNKETLEFELQEETISGTIKDANIKHDNSHNITISLPAFLIENIESITLKSAENEEQQVIYTKKRQF